MSLSSTSTFGLQVDAEGLRALGELAPDRILVGGLSVVEDERRRGELIDRGDRRALGGAHVEHFVAHDRAQIELVVVDRQQHDASPSSPRRTRSTIAEEFRPTSRTDTSG